MTNTGTFQVEISS